MLASRLLIPLKANYKSYFLLPMSRRNSELLNYVHLFTLSALIAKLSGKIQREIIFLYSNTNSITAFTLMKQQNKKVQKVNIFIR